MMGRLARLQIHWFSIFNSFMMVIFLTGIVTLILMRTLRKDYAKYARESGDLDDLDQELDESGWKQASDCAVRANKLEEFARLLPLLEAPLSFASPLRAPIPSSFCPM